MDLKQLRYFVTIVEAGSITRAAEVLCIAQPALSLHVRNLETEFEVRLLSRYAHGVKVTPSGELLYRHAKGILRQSDNTKLLLSSQSDKPSGKVSVGMPSSTAHLIALDIVGAVFAAYPGIELELIESPSVDLQTLVLHGRVDIGLVVLDQPIRGLMQIPLVTEELFVITKPHATGALRELSLRQLSQFPLVLVSPPNTIRTMLDHAFAISQLNYRLVAEVSTTSLLVAAIKRGLGATLLPWSAVNAEITAGTLAATPVSDTTLQRDLSLCCIDSGELTPAVKIVQGAIIDEIKRRVAENKWLGIKRLLPSDALWV
jgi:LysR family nitrogen assimilation transcriptional regulator